MDNGPHERLLIFGANMLLMKLVSSCFFLSFSGLASCSQLSCPQCCYHFPDDSPPTSELNPNTFSSVLLLWMCLLRFTGEAEHEGLRVCAHALSHLRVCAAPPADRCLIGSSTEAPEVIGCLSRSIKSCGNSVPPHSCTPLHSTSYLPSSSPH